MKHLKNILVAVVILAFLLSNTYIAMAYITRQSARHTAPAYADLQSAPEAPLQDTSGEGAVSDQEDQQSSEPADAPAPTGYVYLTIDDGPNRLTTPLILDILDHFNIKASFFVIGTHIKRNPELIVEIDRRGHYIGNHTYNHNYREIYATSESFVRSLQKNEELIFELTGKRPGYIRAPGGLLSKYRAIEKYTEEQGYRIMGWNVDSLDSRNPAPDSSTIAANVYKQSQQEHLWPEMIILVHESSGRMNTVQALPEIIISLLERGFEFVVPLEHTE